MSDSRFADPAMRAARYEALYRQECGGIELVLPESFRRDYATFRGGMERMRRQREEAVRTAIAASIRS